MSNALSVIAQSNGVSVEEVNEVLRRMIISSKGQHGATATTAEMTVVSSIFAKYDLNPFVREGHAFVSGGKLQVIIGIDGWLKIMNRHPDFDGIEYEYEWDEINGKRTLSAVTAKIYTKTRNHPVSVTEWMDECKQQKSDAWQKYEKRMLRNKATGQCIRVAFGISEIIDDDEASRIRSSTKERDITPPEQEIHVDLTAYDKRMSDASNHDDLKTTSNAIKAEMQQAGTWEKHKADIILMNKKHNDRINQLSEIVVEFDDETGEVILDDNN